MKNAVLKGSILVGLGASSYGMLTTFVKMAYHEGFTTAEVTLSQFTLGFTGLFILSLFAKRQPAAAGTVEISSKKSIIKLLVAGTSLGLTSVFYYMAVQYVSVGVGIVLLMQAVWMGVLVETIFYKKPLGVLKVVSVLLVMLGTVLATNLLQESANVQWIGFAWGLLAALSYTATMFSSNNIALHLPPLKRSLYLILGGLIIIAVIFHAALNTDFSYKIFFSWGLLLSLFGTILPPLLFTKGMPLTGVGLGAIIASVEIPVAIVTANVLLNESVSIYQWMGVLLILAAVVMMNLKRK